MSSPVTSPSAQGVSTINTVLAVRDHAPNEIAELDEEITALLARLTVARAKRAMLQDLLAITQSQEGKL